MQDSSCRPPERSRDEPWLMTPVFKTASGPGVGVRLADVFLRLDRGIGLSLAGTLSC